MFTGLVEEIGEVTALTELDDSLRITIAAPLVTEDARHGDSISVSGVCLTVVDLGTHPDGRRTFAADVMAQSIRMSSLGDLTVGSAVNLERAVTADTRLGGHIVQGHVDGTATLSSITEHEMWRVLRFSVEADLAPLFVDKGSVTLAGVSLTLSAVSAPTNPDPTSGSHWIEVSLIPETIAATTLGSLSLGDRVNVETDILARHVARMLQFHPALPTSDSKGIA